MKKMHSQKFVVAKFNNKVWKLRNFVFQKCMHDELFLVEFILPFHKEAVYCWGHSDEKKMRFWTCSEKLAK